MRNVYVPMQAADTGPINANENSTVVDLTNVEKARFGAAGTFGGGTMTLQISLDNGATWHSSGLTLTAPGSVELTTPAKFARWAMTGATSPSVTMAAVLRTFS